MNSLSCLRAGCDLKESWNSSTVLLGSGEGPGLLVFPEVSDTGSWKTSHTAAWWARPGSLSPRTSVQNSVGRILNKPSSCMETSPAETLRLAWD